MKWHSSNCLLRLAPFVIYAVFFGLRRWAHIPMTGRHLAFALAMFPLICTLALIGQRVQLVAYGPGRCHNWGYDLTGLTSGRCPECGTLTNETEGSP